MVKSTFLLANIFLFTIFRLKETRKTNDLKNHLESQNALTNLNNYEKEQTNDYC